MSKLGTNALTVTGYCESNISSGNFGNPWNASLDRIDYTYSVMANLGMGYARETIAPVNIYSTWYKATGNSWAGAPGNTGLKVTPKDTDGWEGLDYAIDRARHYGIKLKLSISNPYAGPVMGEFKTYNPNLATWNDVINRWFLPIATYIAQRYKNDWDVIEITPCNEIHWQMFGLFEGNDDPRWMDLHVAVYDAIKAVQPKIRVALTCLSSCWYIPASDIIAAMTTRNIGYGAGICNSLGQRFIDKFDDNIHINLYPDQTKVIAPNFYSNSSIQVGTSTADITKCMTQLRLYGRTDVKTAITEFGVFWDADPSIQQQSADSITQLYNWSKNNADIDSIILWTFWGSDKNPSSNNLFGWAGGGLIAEDTRNHYLTYNAVVALSPLVISETITTDTIQLSSSNINIVDNPIIEYSLDSSTWTVLNNANIISIGPLSNNTWNATFNKNILPSAQVKIRVRINRSGTDYISSVLTIDLRVTTQVILNYQPFNQFETNIPAVFSTSIASGILTTNITLGASVSGKTIIPATALNASIALGGEIVGKTELIHSLNIVHFEGIITIDNTIDSYVIYFDTSDQYFDDEVIYSKTIIDPPYINTHITVKSDTFGLALLSSELTAYKPLFSNVFGISSITVNNNLDIPKPLTGNISSSSYGNANLSVWRYPTINFIGNIVTDSQNVPSVIYYSTEDTYFENSKIVAGAIIPSAELWTYRLPTIHFFGELSQDFQGTTVYYSTEDSFFDNCTVGGITSSTANLSTKIALSVDKEDLISNGFITGKPAFQISLIGNPTGVATGSATTINTHVNLNGDITGSTVLSPNFTGYRRPTINFFDSPTQDLQGTTIYYSTEDIYFENCNVVGIASSVADLWTWRYPTIHFIDSITQDFQGSIVYYSTEDLYLDKSLIQSSTSINARLQTAISFNANINGSAVVIAPINTQISLDGSVNGSTILTDLLSTGILLNSNPICVSNVSADLTTWRRPTIHFTSDPSQDFQGSIVYYSTEDLYFSGNATGSATIVPTLNVFDPISGSVSGSSIVNGSPDFHISFNEQIVGQASILAWPLKTSVQLVSNLSTTSSGTAELTTYRRPTVRFIDDVFSDGVRVFYGTEDFYLEGSSLGSSLLLGSMDSLIRIAGTVYSSTIINSNPTFNISLDGDMSGLGSVNLAPVTTHIQIAGSLSSAASGTAELTTYRRPTVRFIGDPTFENDLIGYKILYSTEDFYFEGNIHATSLVTSSLTNKIEMAGSITGQATANGSLHTTIKLETTGIINTVNITGGLTLHAYLVGSIAGGVSLSHPELDRTPTLKYTQQPYAVHIGDDYIIYYGTSGISSDGTDSTCPLPQIATGISFDDIPMEIL